MRARIAQLISGQNDGLSSHEPQSLDSQKCQQIINRLKQENESFQAENTKVKQHYKELYDSIKMTRDKTNEKITSLLAEIENLRTKVKERGRHVM